MTTTLDEIAPNIYRLSTFVPDIGPTGFTFNQFLLDDDEPLLFHTGHRSMFPSISEPIERVMPLDHVRPGRIRRVWRDERVARSRAERPGRSWGTRVHGLGQRNGRPASAPIGRR